MSEQICSKCGSQMNVAHRGNNQVLYKCRDPNCGHMTLVQEFERNGVVHERKPEVKQ